MAALEAADVATRAYAEVVAMAAYLQDLDAFVGPVPDAMSTHTAGLLGAIDADLSIDDRVSAVALLGRRLGATAGDLAGAGVELPSRVRPVLAPLDEETLRAVASGDARIDPSQWLTALDYLQREALARRARASSSNDSLQELGGVSSARRLATTLTAAFAAALVIAGAMTLWLVRRNRVLRRSTLLDPLTGVANRRALDAVVSAPVRPATVLMIDVDHFKSVNDLLGHQVGDDVLRAVASALSGVLRNGDTLYRYGGEEFCVVLAEVQDGDVPAVADRLRAAVECLELPGIEKLPAGRLTVSVGVGRRESIQSALRSADAAVFAAKRSGRNCVRVGA